MKKRNQIEECLNDTIESLKSVLRNLNEDESDITNFCDNKYDPEMIEEEKRIYEEKYKKAEPYPLNSRGDWIRSWLSSYKEQQIRKVFYPLIEFLLNDENREKPQFNPYNRFKIYDSLMNITDLMLEKPLKKDPDTQEKLVEVFIKIFPKNIDIFWEIIDNVENVFSVRLKNRESFEKFIQSKITYFEKAFNNIKNKYKSDLKSMMVYYTDHLKAKPLNLINEIMMILNYVNFYTVEEDLRKTLITDIETLLNLEKNEANREILQNLYNDINKLM